MCESYKANCACGQKTAEIFFGKAAWVFDQGYATWVGITPDDTERRNQERQQIQKLAKTDLHANYQAMKEWGLGREKKFMAEGWRKMRTSA